MRGIESAATATVALDNLITTLSGFTVPQCRMVHEQVARDPKTGTPVAHSGSDSGYARRPLCPAARRDQHLACGHTNARNRFIAILAGLDAGSDGHQQPIRSVLDQARQLDLETVLLDHRKGDAELALAKAEVGRNPVAAQAAQADIAALEAEHDRLVRAWRALLDQALTIGQKHGSRPGTHDQRRFAEQITA